MLESGNIYSRNYSRYYRAIPVVNWYYTTITILPGLMDFLLVALRSLSAFHAEIMVPQSQFCHDRTIPAGTSASSEIQSMLFLGDAESSSLCSRAQRL